MQINSPNIQSLSVTVEIFEKFLKKRQLSMSNEKTPSMENSKVDVDLRTKKM